MLYSESKKYVIQNENINGTFWSDVKEDFLCNALIKQH